MQDRFPAQERFTDGTRYIAGSLIISEMPHGGYRASCFGKDMPAYSFEEYTQVKHVMFDNTAMARKPWHRTIFGDA